MGVARVPFTEQLRKRCVPSPSSLLSPSPAHLLSERREKTAGRSSENTHNAFKRQWVLWLRSNQAESRMRLLDKAAIFSHPLWTARTLSGDCLSKEVLNMSNQQMDSMKANLKQIPGWDEDKCPAAKGGNGAGVALVSMSLISLVVARMFL